jgi:hypothetical protein
LGQCDGLPLNEPESELPEQERNERAEKFFAALGATVRWDEAMAAYLPSKDIITMPAIYVLESTGSTQLEFTDGTRRSFEWGSRSMFAMPPLRMRRCYFVIRRTAWPRAS